MDRSINLTRKKKAARPTRFILALGFKTMELPMILCSRFYPKRKTKQSALDWSNSATTWARASTSGPVALTTICQNPLGDWAHVRSPCARKKTRSIGLASRWLQATKTQNTSLAGTASTAKAPTTWVSAGPISCRSWLTTKTFLASISLRISNQ